MERKKGTSTQSRFAYVNLVAARAKELDSGQVPLVSLRGRSPVEIAIAEIAAGKVTAEVKPPVKETNGRGRNAHSSE